MNTQSAARVEPAGVIEDAIAALNSPGARFPLTDVERALELAPNEARLWHLKGLFHRTEGKRELALPALRRATELAPRDALIAHGYARTLLEAGMPSVEAFGRAIKLAPNDPDLVLGLVTALIGERRLADAVSGLETVLARSPQWAAGHSLLSSLRWAEGDRDDFTRSFDRAIEQFPQSTDLRREQIIALLHAEQWDEVLTRIAQGRAALGDHPLFTTNEAVAYSELGDIARADASFGACAEIADPIVQVRHVRHLLRSCRPEAAARLIDQWLGGPQAFMFWPYASLAWRMTADERWQWLEGDDRFVGVYDIADRLPPLASLAETLRSLHRFSGQPLEQSLRGGSQTEGDIFQHVDPVLVSLREAIRSVVAGYVAQLPPADPRHPLLGPPRDSIRFSGAWSVLLRQGGFHANHVHPAGWISSALYIVLPSDLGSDGAGFLTLGDARSPSFPIDLPPLREVRPEPGRLVLFPSYMWHGTRRFGRGERMTVAFDVARPS